MYLGVDIGGSSLKIGVFDEDLNLISQELFSSKDNSFEHKLEELKKHISSFTNKYDINSVGIGFPGALDFDNNVKSAPNLNGWKNKNLNQVFSFLHPIPFFIDNDANVAALSEMKLGAGAKLKSFLFLTLGTGVGGTLILNKEIYRGDTNAAGEIGHFIVKYVRTPPRLSDLTRSGILEEYIGRKQLIGYAKSVMSSNWLEPKADFDVHDINHINDIKIRNEIIDYVAINLSIALISTMNLLDIHNIIIGGGISQIDEYFYESLEKEIKSRALPHIANNFSILKANFLSDAGIFGAAILAKEKYKRKS